MSTPLKDKLRSGIPELEAHKQGRDVLLAFQKDVGFVLSEASDYYSDALVLSKAANILRKMLDHKSTFHGFSHEGYIEQAIPLNFFRIVAMIANGVDMKSPPEFAYRLAVVRGLNSHGGLYF